MRRPKRSLPFQPPTLRQVTHLHLSSVPAVGVSLGTPGNRGAAFHVLISSDTGCYCRLRCLGHCPCRIDHERRPLRRWGHHAFANDGIITDSTGTGRIATDATGGITTSGTAADGTVGDGRGDVVLVLWFPPDPALLAAAAVAVGTRTVAAGGAFPLSLLAGRFEAASKDAGMGPRK